MHGHLTTNTYLQAKSGQVLLGLKNRHLAFLLLHFSSYPLFPGRPFCSPAHILPIFQDSIYAQPPLQRLLWTPTLHLSSSPLHLVRGARIVNFQSRMRTDLMELHSWTRQIPMKNSRVQACKDLKENIMGFFPYQAPTYVPGPVLRLYNDKQEKHHSCPQGGYTVVRKRNKSTVIWGIPWQFSG